MKGLVAILLLLSLVSCAIGELTTGQYHFTTSVGHEEGKSTLSLSATVIVSRATEDFLYSLKIAELLVSENGGNEERLPAESLSLPFQFYRFSNGQVGSVRVHPEETLEIKNIKKAIAESFQTSLEGRQGGKVVETGGNGVREVEYTVARGPEHNTVVVEGSYDNHDFLAFPAGSNMENGGFRLHSAKTTVLSSGSRAVLSSTSVTEISSLRHVRFHSRSELVFETSEIFMIDVVEEADWQIETLMHEVDPSSRVEDLKARLPTPQAIVSGLQSKDLPSREALKLRSSLVALMNIDEQALVVGLEFLSSGLRAPDSTRAQLAVIYSLLARVNAAEAQELLASELLSAFEAGDEKKMVVVLKSLAALSRPSDPRVLLRAVSRVTGSFQVVALADLTIGHLCKLLPAREAHEILAKYVALLEASSSEGDKIQYLQVLGNAGANAPIPLILSHIKDRSVQVRATALSNLRDVMHLAEVQDAVIEMLGERSNLHAKAVVSSLVGSIKHAMKRRHLGEKLTAFLTSVAAEEPVSEAISVLQEFLSQSGHSWRGRHHGRHHGQGEPLVVSSTTIWNDTSDANYNLVAPAALRQQDVDRYPSYTAYLFSNQYGPRVANLKIAGGVFSGAGDDGCLAGDFKIFDKLYTETQLLGNTTVLADLQIYILTYENSFDSRIYAVINGNTIIDFSISNNCSSDDFAIFEGVIEIINFETEIPIDLGNVLIYLYADSGLGFDAGYEICLLTLNPLVELWLTGDISLTVDAGATVTAVGIIRAGLEGDVYLNYAIGPDTQLGSIVNSTTGELVCKACIGVYYGYSDQIAYLGLFIQRREGLGWGDKTTITLSEWVDPAVPFPTPLVEVCSEDAFDQKPSFLITQKF